MARKQLVAGFVLGVFTTLAVVLVLSGGREMPRAMAQPAEAPPTPGAVGRYLASVWAHPGAVGAAGAGSYQPSHGAYLLDTQTGRVWMIDEGGRSTSIAIAR
jgi:hypothetical protein